MKLWFAINSLISTENAHMKEEDAFIIIQPGQLHSFMHKFLSLPT